MRRGNSDVISVFKDDIMRNQPTRRVKLTVMNLSGAFLLLFLGISLSTVTFCMERAFWNISFCDFL